MALIDVIKCQMNDTELCAKYPFDNLRLGTQLVVYPSQVASFVKGGQIFDVFETGTYTLKTSNIPLLNKVINLPFGGNSPFKAEVWFINLTSKLDMKWGTLTPIQLEDPKYKIILPVRAYGQYGLKVFNPELFLKTLIGNVPSFSAEKVDSYFKGKLLSYLNVSIANKMVMDNISILEINTHLLNMSEYCNTEINKHFNAFGLELQEFSIISINVPQDDPSVIKLKEATDLAAQLNIVGRDVYQMERSFDVLEGAATNTGSNSFAGMGAGIGAGVGFGAQMGTMANQMINTNASTNSMMPPPLPPQQTFFVYLNGQQIAGQTPQMIQQMVLQGTVTSATLVWTQGMANWTPAGQVPQLAYLFAGSSVPPTLPTL